jgi:hypothetical protein
MLISDVSGSIASSVTRTLAFFLISIRYYPRIASNFFSRCSKITRKINISILIRITIFLLFKKKSEEEENLPCLPFFLFWMEVKQFLSQRCASNLPVHLCLITYYMHVVKHLPFKDEKLIDQIKRASGSNADCRSTNPPTFHLTAID